MKTDKITFTAEVQLENKRNPKPAPNAYPHKGYIGKDTGTKSTKGSVPLGEKRCEFIDAAKWKSMQVPHVKGTINFAVPDLAPRAAVMWKENENSKDKRIEKIGKDKDAPSSDFFH